MDLLAGTKMYLSKTYKNWYKKLLNEIDDKTIKSSIEKSSHPHCVFEKNIKLSANKYFNVSGFKEMSKCDFTEGTLFTDSEVLKVDFFNSRFIKIPFITTTRTFLGRTDTCPQLLISENNKAYVAVCVNDRSYFSNYLLITRYLKKLKSNIKTIEEAGVISYKGRFIFISKFMGFDYETHILDFRTNCKTELYKAAQVVESLTTFNIFFRNNAPRNLIKGNDGSIYLIDFDHVYLNIKEDIIKIYQKYLSKRVWYADIYNDKQIENLLIPVNMNTKGIKLMADSFSNRFYKSNQSSLGLADYEYVYMQTYKLERKDKIDGINIYGHELGRFISDFWNYKIEADTLYYISGITSEELRILRANLYFLSRIDQELFFRQNYGFNLKDKPVSEKYMKKILRGNLKIRRWDYKNIEISLKKSFIEIYTKISNTYLE